MRGGHLNRQWDEMARRRRQPSLPLERVVHPRRAKRLKAEGETVEELHGRLERMACAAAPVSGVAQKNDCTFGQFAQQAERRSRAPLLPFVRGGHSLDLLNLAHLPFTLSYRSLEGFLIGFAHSSDDERRPSEEPPMQAHLVRTKVLFCVAIIEVYRSVTIGMKSTDDPWIPGA